MIDIVMENRDAATVLRLRGRLDAHSAPHLEARIFEVIESGGIGILIDGEALDYLTSAGLRVLNKAAKRLKPLNGRIVLYNLADYVREVFEISGFDRILPIVVSESEAFERVLIP